MSEEKLKPPEKFPFPFMPYPIQQDFMKKLYTALEEGKLGIFESPTGTGKSLSLICGALRWLLDHEQRERLQLKAAIAELEDKKHGDDGGGDFDWLNQQAAQMKVTQQKQKLQLELNKILRNDEKLEQLQKRKEKKIENHFKKRADTSKKEDERTELPDEEETKSSVDDVDVLLEEFLDEDQDEEIPNQEEEDDKYRGTKNTDCPLADFKNFLKSTPEGTLVCSKHEFDSWFAVENVDKAHEKYVQQNVYFCSRTHSQLAQFVGEVQRSPYGEEVRLVSLASRQNYCINKTVQKLKSLSLINEQCTDMQQKKKGKSTAEDKAGKTLKRSKTSSGCPYFQQRAIEKLRDEALLEVQDVEQLVTLGKQLNACPYYASRAAVSDAQVVVVPYNTLLHKNTRKACGINLAGSIVIIDEAHNLLDTIGHIHSSEVTGYQLTHAHSQLTQYRDRYRSRFSAVNLLYLDQIIFIVGKLIRMLGGKPGCSPVESSLKGVDTKLYTLADFDVSAEIDAINMYNLLKFCEKSRLAQKLHGFAQRYQPAITINTVNKPKQETGIRAFLKEISSASNVDNTTQEITPAPAIPEATTGNPLLSVLSFMESLTNHCKDGRVVCSRQATVGKGSLKYLLLNPAAHFSDIIKEARAVVVAGGTMQPLEEFRDQLFLSAGGTAERLIEFSCGHVIPPEHILPITLAAGPSGKDLDFSFQSRTSLAMLNELGRILINVCNIVPAGIVCFFPSYDYEKLVFQHLEKNGIITKLENKKKVFREPKKAGMVDQILSEYATSISKPGSGGAVMFSVVGGKLSEGLNFSDDLGRCVIVVGMPYPNIKSPELQEKINYLNTQVSSGAGQRHYENLCMKAVNQSIGRAVRHKNDYAAVLLLDQRYTRPYTQNSLPAWIRTSLVSCTKFAPAFAQLNKFFQSWKVKRNASQQGV